MTRYPCKVCETLLCRLAMAEETHKQVQEFYGQRVKSTNQLLTSTCLTPTGEGSAKIKEAIKKVHPEVSSKLANFINVSYNYNEPSADQLVNSGVFL